MNNFEQTFFAKYIPEGQEVIEIFHRHWIKVLDDIILAFGLGVLIPVFLYSSSLFIQENVKFIYFEGYLILIYIIIIYKILDWYNDVLILTKSGITRLEWSLLKSSTTNVDYEHIEGVGVEKSGIFDTILGKGDLIIHKFGEEEIILDEASKPYKIVDRIEEITSKIEHPEENNRFDLMMDALGGMVQNYLGNTNKKREDLFKEDIKNYENNFEKKSKISKELEEEFLKNIEKKDGTIDLRTP